MPYYASNEDVKNKHYYPQYMFNDGYLTLISHYESYDGETESPTIISNSVLWCSKTMYAKNINNYLLSYVTPNEDSGIITYATRGWLEKQENLFEIKDLHTPYYNTYHSELNSHTGFGYYDYSIGVQSYDFDPIDSYNIHSEDMTILDSESGMEETRTVNFPIDLSIVGNYKLKYQRQVGSQHPNHISLFLTLSGYRTSIDADNEESALEGIGFPSYIKTLPGSTLQTLDTTFQYDDWNHDTTGVPSLLMNKKISLGAMSNIDEDKSISSFKANSEFVLGEYFDWDLGSGGFQELSLDQNSLTTYITHSRANTTDSFAFDVDSKFETLGIKKTWAEKDIFSKDFFVNARGRVADNPVRTDYNFVKEVQASIYCMFDNDTDFSKDEHFHLIEKTFREKRYTTDSQNSRVYQPMFLLNYSYGTRDSYLYDIDINSIEILNEYNIETDYSIMQNYGDKCYKISITGLLAQMNSGQLYNEDNANKPKFVYGSFVYDNLSGFDFISDISTIDVDGWSDANDQSDGNTSTEWGKTNIQIDFVEGDAKKVIETAPEIIRHIADKELGVSSFDEDKLNKSIDNQLGTTYALSINKQENSKKIIENICKQSNLFFRYSPVDGRAIIDSIKENYQDTDVKKVIDTSRILKYKYDKTKIDDLCFGGCRVKWGYDYGKEELANITEDIKVKNYGVVDGEDYNFLDQYLAEYGVKDSEKYQLEVEAPYINNEATAIKLRNHLFNFYKNTHLIVKFTIPIQDGIELEVGDVITFDDNIGGLKPYGQTLQLGTGFADQSFYKYYIITSVSKTLDKVDIEVMRLHNLQTINTDFEEEIEEEVEEEVEDTTPVYQIQKKYYNKNYEEYPFAIQNGFVEVELVLTQGIEEEAFDYNWLMAEVLGDGTLDYSLPEENLPSPSTSQFVTFSFDEQNIDYTYADKRYRIFCINDAGTQTVDFNFIVRSESQELVFGDVTGDFQFNVLDVVAVTNYVLDPTVYDLLPLQFQQADVVQDGTIDILDLIEMMIIILGD